jgi:protein-S-isoprenylcysteine O-methyltransferase Ste14
MLNTFWLWAFLTMFFMFMCTFVLASKKLGSNSLYGSVFVTLLATSRVIMVLPFVKQPRFMISDGMALFIGIPVFAIGIIFCLGTAPFIHPVTRPMRQEKLKTDGLYGIMRHPLMFGEILWPIGWSIIFRSTAGLLFSAVWILCMYMFSILEEEKLVEEYGEAYLNYQKKVPKFIPRLWKK